MANTELVIKIPDRIYYGIEKGITVNGSRASQIVLDAIKNGTPLPKGHGNIIDVRAITKARIENDVTNVIADYNSADSYNYLWIEAPTIIEADKGEENKC